MLHFLQYRILNNFHFEIKFDVYIRFQGKIEKFSYLAANKNDKEDKEPFAAKSSPAMNRKQKQWEDKLSANKAGAQNNAEEFTKQFMQDMYSESSMTNIETREEMTRSEETHAVIIGKSLILFFGDVIIQPKKSEKYIIFSYNFFSLRSKCKE